MKTFLKALNLLTRKEKSRGLCVLLMVIIMAILETAGVASVMPFLAVLGNPQMLEENRILLVLFSYAQAIGINTPDQFLIALGIAAFALIIISAAYRTLAHYALNRFIEMRRHSISSRLLESYLHHPYEFFLNRHSSDMSKTILSEVDQVVAQVFRPIILMISYIVVLLAITSMLLIVNPLLAFLAAGILGGLYTLIYLALRHYLSRLGKRRAAANKGRFMAAGEAFGGIKSIKLSGREDSYLSRFREPSRIFAASQATHQTLNQVPQYLIEAIAFGGILFLTLWLLITAGGLNSGALGEILPILGLYAFAAYRMQPALRGIFQGLASLRYGQAAVDSLHSDLHSLSSAENISSNRAKALKAKRSIQLSNLSYTYPNASKSSLSKLDLKIPVGSSIGLVGSTGAGKTTLVDIILGLLPPSEGSINVDENPINSENLRNWQQCLGYVPQEIFLNDSSLEENIAFGLPVNEIDRSQVISCARMAQVHDFVVGELPDKYDTVVGERGVRLSGGQRQRIGIARALYHNPEILVFDEATSALDDLTELAVMDAIDTLAKQKTIIIIAHRLSTVKSCDQVVLLEKGRIKDRGNFSELVDKYEHFGSQKEK